MAIYLCLCMFQCNGNVFIHIVFGTYEEPLDIY